MIKRNYVIKNLICLLYSFCLGIYYNISVFFISAYKMIKKEAFVLCFCLCLAIVLWCFIQYNFFNVHVYNITALGGLFVSISIYRSKWTILEILFGNDYNLYFDNFQNINPIYYISDDYFAFIFIILLSSLVVTFLKKKKIKINLTENKLELTFRKYEGKKSVNLSLPFQAKYYFYCESHIKAGHLSIEVISVDNKKMYVNSIFPNSSFEFELLNGDYIINLIGNRCIGDMYIDWHLM